MTDNQDSVTAGAVQPPTDRPLTAGDFKPAAGHCDDPAAWAEFVRQYDGQPRSMPNVTDFALANRVFMADRNDLDLIVWQTAAKERIRWLSIELAKAQHVLSARPATSAASEVEDLAGKLTAIRDKFLMPTPDKDHTDYAVITRCIAALASPPVSERERELEGALRVFADVLADVGEDEADDDLYAPMSAPHRRAEPIRIGHLRRARALTVQPAGEGK